MFYLLSLIPSSVLAQIVPCQGIDCSLCDFFVLGQNIFNFVVWTLVPIIGTGMVLWSGFTILTAGEKPDQVKKGRKMITATLIGIAIIYSSYLMASFVVKFFAGNGIASSSFKNGKFEISCEDKEIKDVTGQFLKDGSFNFKVGEDILIDTGEIAPEAAPKNEQVVEGLGTTKDGVGVQVKTNPGVSLDDVNPTVVNALKLASNDASINGLDLVVTSGLRDISKQWDLVDKNCKKDPSTNEYGAKCDPLPGHAITCIPKDTDKNGSVDGQNCRHTTGLALDVWGYSQDTGSKNQNKTIQIMQANGFCYYNKEIWHFELKSILAKDPNRLNVFICN